MKKQIFAVNPLSKIMENGEALYGIQLRLNGLQNTQQIWKTIPQYCKIEKQIAEVAFDFQQNIQKQLPKALTDEDKLKLITDFVNECKNRPDIISLIIFRQFFQLAEIQFQYLNQFNRINVASKDNNVIDLAFDANLGILFTLHKPKSKSKIITNFFKQLLSKQTNIGVMRIYRQEGQSQKWKLANEVNFESEPYALQWSQKSNILLVSTAIGIFSYIIKVQGSFLKQQLVDFVKIYDIKNFKYGAKTGSIYFGTGQKLYMHSINKQFTMQINSTPFHHVRSLEINRAETRMYCSQDENLRIFDISNVKDIKQIAKIEQIGSFNRLKIFSDKYLFGLTEDGYVSVFQIQQPGKERLTNVLTNIDCPPHSPFFAFNERAQMIMSSNGQYIVLISTKNVPLFAGGCHKKQITAGLYDADSSMVITADLENQIIFYNFSLRKQEE